jgi:signal transduction histidine kinase
MFNFIRGLSLISILISVFLFVTTIILIDISYTTIKNDEQNRIYENNDFISNNYVNSLQLSFSFTISPLNYGEEYMSKYTIFNSTLNDYVDLSALNNTINNHLVNNLNLYYIVNDTDRIVYETRISSLVGSPVVFTDFSSDTKNISLVIAPKRDFYCPLFFLTPFNNESVYLPGLDICNIPSYKELVLNFLKSPIDSVTTGIRNNQQNKTFLDFGKRTTNGLVILSLILENVISLYISNTETVSIKKNNDLIFNNCDNNCINGIDKNITLINNEILVFTFFFTQEDIDLSKFLFILIGIIFFDIFILVIIANFEIQKKRYIIADKMLGYINHELRSPCNIIVGLIEISLLDFEERNIQLTNDEIQIINNLHIAQKTCDFMSYILDDILDLKLINQGKLIIQFAEIRFDNFLFTLQRIISVKFLDKPQISFIISNPNNIEILYFDEKRLLQIVINFLTNAIKFTDNGSITLLIKYTDIKDIIRISIIDTGIGIKEDEYENMFKPFDQSNMHLNKNFQSIGIGLFLCKMIMDQINGKIGFNSTFGSGSEFYIEFNNSNIT